MEEKKTEDFFLRPKWQDVLKTSLGEVTFDVDWTPTDAGREFLEAQRRPIVGREVRIEKNGRLYTGRITGFDNGNLTLTVEFEGDAL